MEGKEQPPPKRESRLLQNKLRTVVPPASHKILLSPLHKVGQHIASTSIGAYQVLVLPDLQADQHDTDIQHDVHLERQEKDKAG